MINITRRHIATLALAASAAFATHTHAGVISIDETITKTPPPGSLNGNMPFNFNFNNLPTAPLTNATLTIFGAHIDLDGNEANETFTVQLDGIGLGAFGPFGADASIGLGFSEPITILIGDLTAFLADGSLHVRVDLGAGVDTDYSPFGTTTLSANLAYRASDVDAPELAALDVQVPEPASLALLGLGLVGLGLSRLRRA